MKMEKQCFFTIFVVTFVGLTTGQSSLTKVSIYYESLCPGSIYFISNQLYPNYETFEELILLDFVPYGNANQTKSATGEWSFSCQHGEKECRGNKYQACALNQKKSQGKAVEFVNCVMTLSDPSDPKEIQNCAVENGYDKEALTTCYNSQLGSELLAAYGNRTHSLKPKLDHVPTIIFNDQFDQDSDNMIRTDFEKAICSNLPEPKPTVCKG